MQRSSPVFLGALLTLVGAPSLRAQHPQVREGFWIAFGPGYGSSHFNCTGCTGETKSGPTFDVRLGGTLKPYLLLGGDLSAWTHSENGVSETFGTAAFTGYFYPKVQSGLFVKAGAGISTAHFEAAGQTAYGTGIGGLFGAGYDIRVGRNVSITPNVQFQYGAVGNIKFPSGGTYFASLSQSLIAGGVEVTFH